MLGKAVSIDLKALKKAFTKVVKDYPYIQCFHRVVLWGAEIGYHSIPREKVNFTFDISSENKANAPAIYLFDNMMKSPKWKYSSILGQISFTNRENYVGLQVADILSRETMKYSRHRFDNSNKIRESMKVIAASRKFHFDIFDKESIKELKHFYSEDDPVAKGYEQWLRQNDINVDNYTFRQKYFSKKDKS